MTRTSLAAHRARTVDGRHAPSDPRTAARRGTAPIAPQATEPGRRRPAPHRGVFARLWHPIVSGFSYAACAHHVHHAFIEYLHARDVEG